MVVASDGEGVRDVDELEAEVARLEQEAERLHQAYIAAQNAFEW